MISKVLVDTATLPSAVIGTNQPSSHKKAAVSKALVVIDAGVADYQMLADGVIENVEVLILNPDADGIQQITTALQNHRNIDSLHIVSHGTPGSIAIGNSYLSLDTLDRYAWDLQSWFGSSFRSLDSTRQILLYGCNVAAGAAGVEFIEKLHHLTGAAIAASTTPTGNAALGGNWDWEKTVGGDINLEVVFQAKVAASYAHILAITNGSFETGNFSGWTVSDLSNPYRPLKVESTGTSLGSFGFFAVSPTDGNFAATHGFDGSVGTIRIAQDVTISTETLLSFDYRVGYNMTFGATLDRVFFVNVNETGGGANLATFNLFSTDIATKQSVSDTGNLAGFVNLDSFIGQTVQLAFDVFIPQNFTGPAAFQLDNIRLTDVIAPAVSLTSDTAGDVNAPFTVTATFSEAVTGFNESDISITNGLVSNLTGSGNVYTFLVTPGSDGEVSVNVGAGAAQDAAGNGNTAAGSALTRTFDATVPAVSLTSDAAGDVNAPFTVTATFSEAVTGFEDSDISITNGEITNFSGDGTVYTFTVTPTGEGEVSVNVGAGAAQDAAGNPSSAASSALTRTFDVSAPTVSLTSAAAEDVNAPFTVTATFSEAVTGFEDSDISITNGEITNFSGDGTVYTFTVTPTGEEEVSVNVGAGVAQDAAGNPSSAASSALTRSFDVSAPMVSLTSEASAAVNAPFTVTATFSEAVTGFETSDITITNASISNFAGNGTLYTFLVTPGNDGEVSVNVGAGVAQDAAGNGNTAAGSALIRTFDTQPATVSLTSEASAAVNASFTVTATFSEAVSGFEDSDISITNGSISNLTGSGNVYTFLVTPGSDGEVSINVGAGAAQDAAGNANTAAGSVLTRMFDTQASNVGVVKVGAAIRDSSMPSINIEFTEVVSNFDLSDIVLTRNGKAIPLESASLTTADNKTWTLSNIDALTERRGNYQIQILSGSVTDSAGNILQQGSIDSWLTGYTADLLKPINFAGGIQGIELTGTRNRDLLTGTHNRDVLKGSSGNDLLRGLPGNDRLEGGDGNDRLEGGMGADILIGGRGDDILIGGLHNDRLVGGDGNDTLIGGQGNDVLIGGLGQDLMKGGIGTDTFVYTSLAEGGDRIQRFEPSRDLIDLRNIFNAPEFSAENRFAQYHQYIQLVQVGADTRVQVDADGQGRGEIWTTLATLENITAEKVNSKNFVLG